MKTYKELLDFCIKNKTRVIKRIENTAILRNGKQIEVTFDKEFFKK